LDLHQPEERLKKVQKDPKSPTILQNQLLLNEKKTYLNYLATLNRILMFHNCEISEKGLKVSNQQLPRQERTATLQGECEKTAVFVNR